MHHANTPVPTPLLGTRTLSLLAALSAVLAFPMAASAELQIRELNQTLDGAEFSFDLDQDGSDDFNVVDDGAGGAWITSLNPEGAGIIVDAATGSLTPDYIYIIGGLVQQRAGSTTATQAILAGQGGPFSEPGFSAFVGFSIDDNETSNFGFLEITRGSTILGTVGYQTTPGAPAVIPVPEPTAVALGLFAAMGMLTLRRR